MTEGTKSVLFGCHSIVHSWYVLKAWRLLYRKWPKLWQIICIIFHDIGHLGKNYLSNAEEQAEHWFLGACISGVLVGKKGFSFVASHTKNPFVPLNPEFEAADRYAQVITSNSWLYWNKWVEKLVVEPKKWKRVCLENMKNLEMTNHEIFLLEIEKEGLAGL